jgi:O-antigen ligase
MLASVSFSPGGVAAAAVVGIVAIVVGVAALEDRRAFVRDMFCDRWVAVLALFFAVMAMSLVNAGEFATVAKKALTKKWGEYLLLAIIARYSAMRSGVRIPLTWGLVGLGVCLLDTAWQAATGFDLFRLPMVSTNIGSLHGLTGPFGHYNGLSGYLMPWIVVTAGLCVQEKGRIRAVLACVCAAALSCLLFTYSRGAWLSAACALLYAGIVVFPKVRVWALGSILAALSGVLATPFLRERLIRTFGEHGDAGRFEIWEGARKMIVDHPFVGIGVGTFMQQLPKYKDFGVKLYAHNCYLQIAAETGVLSLVLFAAIYAMTLMRLHRAGTYAAKIVTIVLVGLAVILAFDTYLYSIKSAGMFWVIMGFAAGIAVRKDFEGVV